MRIVIDMQGAQSTGSRQRGIGRYTLALAKALVRNCREKHDILLSMNGLFPDSIETLRAAFDDLLPRDNIRVWKVPGPVSYLSGNNSWRRQTAELMREAFLASLQPDIVLVSSIFEGLEDDAVASVGKFKNLPTAVILYDLIPYIYPHSYLENPFTEAWYLSKMDHLRRAELLLSISESSRQEAIQHLGFEKHSVYNISTAADAYFIPRRISAEEEKAIREKYELYQPFVMYTGGIDLRKNIEGLIRAYAILPKDIRYNHQLAVVCSIQSIDRQRLEELAQQVGLEKHELVLTGFVPEETLVELYNLCKLFVFPSLHEGFGLPALEAMSCGAAVIGSGTSSVPEVIGREDALFDPYSDEAISEKIRQGLTDEHFRKGLEQHGLEQAKRFSWDQTAKRAVVAFERWHTEQAVQIDPVSELRSRPKLAYVSPLPPERSGISDYSAELLPELSRFYDIDVIVAQETVSDSWIKAVCKIRDVEWFRRNANKYDRVLYHFGNSHFHRHMFDLLDEIPGTVVLHDFFLSNLIHYMEVQGLKPDGWTAELYRSHGYKALQEWFLTQDSADNVVWKYPCNYDVLQSAQGVIVHSEYPRKLAEQWYPLLPTSDWAVIPLLRVLRDQTDRDSAREVLGLKESDFVVCSFGHLGPIKQNHRLLVAWINSKLAHGENSVLVFVGENPQDEYGSRLAEAIGKSGLNNKICTTGWVDSPTRNLYLMAADVAVQLRTQSRGETSAAALDCMNAGLPTIVNAHGSLAELPNDTVYMLPAEFEDHHLIDALETLWMNESQRALLGAHARELILTNHNPRSCAGQYFTAIERFYQASSTDSYSITKAIAQLEQFPSGQNDLILLSEAIAQTFPPKIKQKQLLVDVSELVQRDSKSGIQRVVRNILIEWLTNPPEGWRIEPVYATEETGYRYARQFTLEFLNCPEGALADEPIEYAAGDIFIGLDLQFHILAQRTFLQQLRQYGVQVLFLLYDLLPVQMPQNFSPDVVDAYRQWLDVILKYDGVICISRSVANELSVWMKSHGPSRLRPLRISWFHLGANPRYSASVRSLSDAADDVLQQFKKRPTFLMVGTVEPRKGHAQTLMAFEQLWKEGHDLNLVIVGKPGWLVESLVEQLRSHPELGNRLFWLESAIDELLERIYGDATCLIAASQGEGFGLPLIEAAQHKLPIIARDIPVFREVAGEHAFYFTGLTPESLANAIQQWIDLYKAGKPPSIKEMPFLTWEESAQRLFDAVMVGQPNISNEISINGEQYYLVRKKPIL